MSGEAELEPPTKVGQHPGPSHVEGEAVDSEEVGPPPINEIPQIGGGLCPFRDHWTFSPWAHSIISRSGVELEQRASSSS